MKGREVMIKLDLKDGFFATIDDEDVDLADISWNNTHRGAAGIFLGKQRVLQTIIAERILGRPMPRGRVIKFRDGRRLNCRRSNLLINNNTWSRGVLPSLHPYKSGGKDAN